MKKQKEVIEHDGDLSPESDEQGVSMDTTGHIDEGNDNTPAKKMEEPAGEDAPEPMDVDAPKDDEPQDNENTPVETEENTLVNNDVETEAPESGIAPDENRSDAINEMVENSHTGEHPVTEQTENDTEAKENGDDASKEDSSVAAINDSANEEKPQDEKAGETTDNAAFVSEQIDKLIRLKDEHNFTDFWFYVKEMNKTIFTLRGIPKDERMKFKDRIGELCDDAKKMQDDLKARVAKTSHLKLERIQQITEESLSFGKSHDELEKSFFKLEEANKFLREGKVQGEDGTESADMSREHREKAKDIIKAAKDQIFDRKREIREANFKKVTQRLNTISDALLSSGRAQKVFDGVKSLRNEMKTMNLDRSQLREIDTVIEALWKKAREKATTGRVQDAKSQISGLADLARRKDIFIKTLEKEIKDLNIKWSSVQNDFFKNRVNEWIAEKKEKIEATRKELESVQEKINFLTEQMQRTNPA